MVSMNDSKRPRKNQRKKQVAAQALRTSVSIEMEGQRTSSAPGHEPASHLEQQPLLNGADSQCSIVPPAGRADEASRPSSRDSSMLYMILLTFFGGIGGFLFGYDTGVISGALPYLRDDLLAHYQHDISMLNWLQEIIVSAAVFCAAIGAAVGGWLSDRLGRKKTLLVGDVLFGMGALLMGLAQNVHVLIAGRALVGLGVGLASVTVPVYIAEAAPRQIRATLVTINVLMITTGQFSAYVVDYAFTYVDGTWRWMLGVAGLPAVLQFVGLMFLPESPRWLASKGQMATARKVLRLLRPPADIDKELVELQNEVIDEAARGNRSVLRLLRFSYVQSELMLGLGLQVLQQLCGINTVMYYTPAILEVAGYRDKRAALLMALLPAAVNAVGTVVGAWYIDRCGRRKLLLSSMGGVVVALGLLGLAFYASETHTPLVAKQGSSCWSIEIADCNDCIRNGCLFCGPQADSTAQGVCQAQGLAVEGQCTAPGQQRYTNGCPSPYTAYIIGGLMLYLAAFSPGLGPVPWAVNAEIYPLQLRGLASGAAATCNWVSNAVVSQTFLTTMQHLGGSGTFWSYAAIAALGMMWVSWMLPETNGLSLEEVQEVFKSEARLRCGLVQHSDSSRSLRHVQSLPIIFEEPSEGERSPSTSHSRSTSLTIEGSAPPSRSASFSA